MKIQKNYKQYKTAENETKQLKIKQNSWKWNNNIQNEIKRSRKKKEKRGQTSKTK